MPIQVERMEHGIYVEYWTGVVSYDDVAQARSQILDQAAHRNEPPLVIMLLVNAPSMGVMLARLSPSGQQELLEIHEHFHQALARAQAARGIFRGVNADPSPAY
jgi:hypothetical protein